MRIILTGATGFIGKKLGLRLVQQGHELIVLVRNPSRAKEQLPFPCEALSWDPTHEDRNTILKDLIQNADAVIHLAGESIGEKRWTSGQKKKLLESRTKTTRALHELVARLPGRKPRVFISASAIGFYGDRGDEVLSETSSAGSGFLAELCKQWEREIFSHGLPEMRVVALRFGMVLGRDGGALEKLIHIFKRGFGSALGNGKQWVSWIHIRDLLALLEYALLNPVEGVMNATSPNPVRNEEFTRILAKRLCLWRLPKVPAFVLKLVLGEMSELVLASQRVIPEKAVTSGFKFYYEQLDPAIHNLTADIEAARGSFTHEVIFEQFVPKKVEEVWPFFTDANNLERITPPFLNFEILEQTTPKIEQGTEFEYRLKVRGLPLRWRTHICDWRENEHFADFQLKGPYSLWHHTHSFQTLQKGTLITDRILYRLPLGYMSHTLVGGRVARDIQEIFAYRKQVIRKTFG